MVVADTTPPGLAPLTAAPAWAAPAAAAPGLCNAYLPDDSTLSRFLWTVDHLAHNGFYIVLDNQFNLDQTVLKDQALWLQRARRPAPQPAPQPASHHERIRAARSSSKTPHRRACCVRGSNGGCIVLGACAGGVILQGRACWFERHEPGLKHGLLSRRRRVAVQLLRGGRRGSKLCMARGPAGGQAARRNAAA